MIIVDEALRRRQADSRPITVALVGAGFMGRGIALQIMTVAAGMRLVAIVSRNLELARRACREAGAPEKTDASRERVVRHPATRREGRSAGGVVEPSLSQMPAQESIA